MSKLLLPGRKPRLRPERKAEKEKKEELARQKKEAAELARTKENAQEENAEKREMSKKRKAGHSALQQVTTYTESEELGVCCEE